MQFTANVKDSSVFSTQKRWCNGTKVDALTVGLLATVSAGDDASDVLDMLSEDVKIHHIVDTNRIGHATSVLY